MLLASSVVCGLLAVITAAICSSAALPSLSIVITLTATSNRLGLLLSTSLSLSLSFCVCVCVCVCVCTRRVICTLILTEYSYVT